MKASIRKYFFLILAGAIILTGILTTAISFIGDNPIKNREYLLVNSKTTLILKPGKYSTFYEYKQSENHSGPIKLMRNNRITDIDSLLSIMVESKTDQIQVNPDASMNYSINELRGESLYSFFIEEEGEYDITINTSEHAELSNLKIALISDFTKGLISLFINIGTYILASVPFMIIGLIRYWIEGKKKYPQNI